MADDRMILVYAENGIRVELGKILTNHSMSIDDALNILEIDMDAFADSQGWDGWNFEALKLEYSEGEDEMKMAKNAETIYVTVDQLGPDGSEELAERMSELLTECGWDAEYSNYPQSNNFEDEEQEQEYQKSWEKCLSKLAEEIEAEDDPHFQAENKSGTMIYYGAAAQHMDDDLREELNAKLAPYSKQKFFSAYEKAHKEKFGEDWFLSEANPVW